MNEVHINHEHLEFVNPDCRVIATAPFKYLLSPTIRPYLLAMIGAWVKETGCSGLWLVDNMNLVHTRYNLSQMIK